MDQLMDLSMAIVQQLDPAGVDAFGDRVAIDGDTIVVSAPEGNNGAGHESGRVWIYRRHAAGLWLLEQELVPSTPEAGAQFGFAVAIAGDTVFVGAPYKDNGTTNAGSVYVFRRGGEVWIEQQEIAGSKYKGMFGRALCTDDGTRLVVGEPEPWPFRDGGDGTVHTYTELVGSWSLEQSWSSSTATGTGYAEGFGARVAIDPVAKDCIAVGLPGRGGLGDGTYCYFLAGSVWGGEHILTVGGSWSVVGCTCAMRGNLMVMGSPEDYLSYGDVHTFTRDGTSWAHQQTFQCSDTDRDQHFGREVCIDPFGKSIYVAAPGINKTGDSPGGSVYRFANAVAWAGAGWVEKEHLSWEPSYQNDGFGTSLACSPSVLVIGCGTADGIKIYEAAPVADPWWTRLDMGGEYCLEITDERTNAVVAQGLLNRDYTVASRCRFRLMCRRGEYWADPELGSRLHTIYTLKAARAKADTYVKEALQPLVDEAAILEAAVVDVQQDPATGMLLAHASVTIPEGESVDLGLIPLGVA